MISRTCDDITAVVKGAEDGIRFFLAKEEREKVNTLNSENSNQGIRIRLKLNRTYKVHSFTATLDKTFGSLKENEQPKMHRRILWQQLLKWQRKPTKRSYGISFISIFTALSAFFVVLLIPFAYLIQLNSIDKFIALFAKSTRHFSSFASFTLITNVHANAIRKNMHRANNKEGNNKKNENKDVLRAEMPTTQD